MVGVIVNVCDVSIIDMDIQPPYGTLECTDCFPHFFRVNAVCKCNCSGSDAVFHIDPSYCPYEYVLEDSAGVVKVVDKVSETVSASVFSVEIGSGII